MKRFSSLSAATLAGLCLGTIAVPAAAQDETAPPPAAQPGTQPPAPEHRGATGALTDTIVVTARKRGTAENVEDVPIAITAYGSKQLDALKVRDLQSLTFSMPNVALDDISTARGVANFTIRGLGINSSIPSIDPAVGVFVDGMYLGINGGVVLDIFDLQSIEVLRGPQGVLFGRNVTGGAVLINTKKPSDEFEMAGKASVESGFRGTGLNYNVQAYVTGPVMGDKVLAKVAGYYRKDDGWFKNSYDGKDFGKSETWIVRPSVTFRPTAGSELTVRYEHGYTNGDGPAAQSHTNGTGVPGYPTNFDRKSFNFSVDERGFGKSTWDQVIAQMDVDVPFGEGGKITNIFGWRKFSADSLGDIDAQPVFGFHAPSNTRQHQLSNEFRYFGRFFDRVDLTAGVFYFTQSLKYAEIRDLLGVLLAQPAGGIPYLIEPGGGMQDHHTLGIFGNADIDLTKDLTLYAGVRWSRENKDVRVANLLANLVTFPATVTDSGCNIVLGPACTITLKDSDEWKFWSPRVGLQYRVDSDSLVYVQWARSFRSGGYNLRDTAIYVTPQDVKNLGPGPFDPEQVDSYEAGVKTGLFGRGILNGSIFFTQIGNMQREVNLASPVSGVLQIIKNTADAEIFGLEVETQYSVTDNFLLRGSLGYLDGYYTDVRYDLNGDGNVDQKDLNLDIPRLAPITYNVGFVYDYDLGNAGVATLRFNYANRDQAAYTDNNLGYLNAAHVIDASLALTTWGERAIISLYGKNLLNNVQHGNDTQLPTYLGPWPTGGTFAPLIKGRVIGLELQVHYN